MPSDSSNKSFLQTVLTMIDNIGREGHGYDTLINMLALLCLLSILNHLQPPTTTGPSSQPIQPSPPTNPLQKIIGDLTKNMDGGGGGPSPDMLMSLLPLLNNPQVKSKLNPANISNILGLMNNLGGSNNNDKPEPVKSEKVEKKESPAAAMTTSLVEQPAPSNKIEPSNQDKKDLGRSLNWKNNFQNEKEV